MAAGRRAMSFHCARHNVEAHFWVENSTRNRDHFVTAALCQKKHAARINNNQPVTHETRALCTQCVKHTILRPISRARCEPYLATRGKLEDEREIPNTFLEFEAG